MLWCSHCGKCRETVREPDQDYVCCPCCGKVLEYPVYKSGRMIGETKKNQDLRGRAVNLESLFDIDDLEVAQYLHNEEEKRLKKIIWEEMNNKYFEEQAVKKAAAAAAAEGACQARLANGFEEMLSTQELAAVTAAALAKSRKEKKHKRATKNMNSNFEKSCGGTGHELKRKSFSSKINYEVLESLYKDNIKKQRTESKTGEGDDSELKKSIEETIKESDDEAAVVSNVDGDNDDDDHYQDGNDDHYNNEDGDYYGNGEDEYYERPDEEYGYDE